MILVGASLMSSLSSSSHADVKKMFSGAREHFKILQPAFINQDLVTRLTLNRQPLGSMGVSPTLQP